MEVPSESELLRFTFVPSFGLLPTQFHIADASAGVEGRAVDKNYHGNTGNRNKTVAVAQPLGNSKKGKCEAPCSTNSSHSLFRSKKPNTSREVMDGEDLFKAEFVFLTDSDEDTKAGLDHSYRVEKSSILEASRVPARGESRRQEDASQLPLHSDLPYTPATHHKHSQLTNPLSTPDHPSHISPVPYFFSSTNLKTEHKVIPLAYPSSSLQELPNQWQSENGSLIHQSSTIIHSTTSSLPLLCSLTDNVQLTSSLKTKIHQESETKDSSSFSQLLRSTSQGHSPIPSMRFTTWSVVPICLTRHVLSPSPKPLSSPLHDSSSSLCSPNNPCSQMSSTGNLPLSGGKSPLPTRLSLLTALLKSGSSPKRLFYPASCPATFSPNSLGSSMVTIDQRFNTTHPTPKKSTSSFSVRSTSPSQDECHLSVFPNVLNCTSWSSKSSPDLRMRSPSPKSQLDVRALSPDKLQPLSPTISSYRKTVVSPLLQPKLPSLSLPPNATRKGPQSPNHRTRGPENSKRVHTYSPMFTAKSIPVSASLTSQRGSDSSTSQNCCYSSRLGHSSGHSRQLFPQAFATALLARSPASPSTHWPIPHTDSTLPPRPNCYAKPSAAQRNSSTVHSKFRSWQPSSRPSSRARAPAGTEQGSPTTVPSLCSLLPRYREPSSPLFFSLHSDSDNKIPKIKASYKAFAAIPTNTLLLEQKALDDPAQVEAVGENKVLDTHSEMCSPAQLRQQTEELCAAIDQVLQDPLAKFQGDSSPRSLQNMLDSDVSKTSATSQRITGRETRYANLHLSGSGVPMSQKTKPGVIRPTVMKAKIIIQDEEAIQPNPFKKYLGENSNPEPEELCSARVKDKPRLPPYQDKKDLSKGNFSDPMGFHSRSHCQLRGDFKNEFSKPT